MIRKSLLLLFSDRGTWPSAGGNRERRRGKAQVGRGKIWKGRGKMSTSTVSFRIWRGDAVAVMSSSVTLLLSVTRNQKVNFYSLLLRCLIKGVGARKLAIQDLFLQNILRV